MMSIMARTVIIAVMARPVAMIEEREGHLRDLNKKKEIELTR